MVLAAVIVIVQIIGAAQDVGKLDASTVDLGPLQIVHPAIGLTKRGARLSRSTYNSDDGTINESPDDLIEQAKQVYDFGNANARDVYSMARAIRSEVGDKGGEITKTGVGWAIYNRAQDYGMSIYSLLTKNDSYISEFGGAKNGSTRQDPYASDADVAMAVLYGGSIDPTNRSIGWDSPRGQRAALAKLIPKYSRTPEQVAAARVAQGLAEVHLDGVNPDFIRFWRKA